MANSNVTSDLLGLGTCTVSDALDRLGLPGAVTGIIPMYPGCSSFVGRAITVTLGPRRPEDPTGAHLATDALAQAVPGDVLLIANQGRRDVSSWGGMLTVAATQRNVAGVVIDGACRDIEDARSHGFPVFARGLTPVSAKGRTRQVATNDSVAIDGIRVDPGDYVIADDNGLVFVPASEVHHVCAVAGEIAQAERDVMESLCAGADPSAVIDDRRSGGAASE